MKKNRVCCTCGKEYRYCPDCIEFTGLPTWMICFDTGVCRNLWNILSNHTCNSCTDNDVIKFLQDNDINDVSHYTISIQKQIKKIVNNKIQLIYSDELMKNDISESNKENVESNINVLQESSKPENNEEIENIENLKLSKKAKKRNAKAYSDNCSQKSL